MAYFLTSEAETAALAKSLADPKTHTPLLRVKERGLRFYSATLSRWVNRDPIGERGGVDLYVFLGNGPVDAFDRLGLDKTTFTDMPNQTRVFPEDAVDVDFLTELVCWKYGTKTTYRVVSSFKWGYRLDETAPPNYVAWHPEPDPASPPKITQQHGAIKGHKYSVGGGDPFYTFGVWVKAIGEHCCADDPGGSNDEVLRWVQKVWINGTLAGYDGPPPGTPPTAAFRFYDGDDWWKHYEKELCCTRLFPD
jgi:RHS repeat-associated protein